jgi:RNA polymerase sigma factor (sigma-70 family)
MTGGAADSGAGSVPALTSGQRRPEIEAELARWYRLDQARHRSELQAEVEGLRAFSLEALVHVSREAFRRGDRKTLNLAFEALSKAAAPLLLSQAWGLAHDECLEQVQEILLNTLEAIRADKADFAEINFAAFAKRRSISLFRSRQTRLEGISERIEPTDELDPIEDVAEPQDDLPARLQRVEAAAFLAQSLDKLSPRHREVFIQYHCLSLTQGEIAKHHGVTARTIRLWLKRATDTIGLSGGHDDH